MKKSLMISGAFLGLLTANVSSYALPVLICRYQPRPGMTGRAQDLGRSVTGFISSIIQLCGDGESKAQLIATQEENNANTSGSSGSTSGTDTSSGSLTNAIEVDCGSGDSSSANSIGIANPLYSSSSSSSSGTASDGVDTSGIANPLLPSADSTTGSSGDSGNSGTASSGSATTGSSNTQTSGGNTTTTGSSGGSGNSGTASSGFATTGSSGTQTSSGNTTTTGSSGGSGNSTTASSDSSSSSVSTFCRSEFPGSAFNYVNTNLLAKEGNVGYKPLKTALASASETDTLRQNIRKTVLDEFFADTTKSEQATTEYQEKIRRQRNTYVQEAAARHVTVGYRVKGHIQNDLAVISSASLSGDGELGAIAVDSHTLEQMVKMELVDLALQMEMMEADAIQFLMHQPVVLMSETKPTSSN